MDKTEATDHLRDTLESDIFLERLQTIAVNYPNQKQEGLIRNAILEIFNQFNSVISPHLKAVAEHRIKGKKVDLSFINKEFLSDPIQVEFKFQFSKDFKRFLNYKSVIGKDLVKRESDAFVLIVPDWQKKKKKKFDEEWALKPNLNQYICNKDLEVKGNPEWKENLFKLVNSFEYTSAELVEQEVDEPYPIKYYFYLLIKHSEEDWETVSGEEFHKALECSSN